MHLLALKKLKAIMLLSKLFLEREYQQQLELLVSDLSSKVYLLIQTSHTLEVIKFMSNGLVTLCSQVSYLRCFIRVQLS